MQLVHNKHQSFGEEDQDRPCHFWFAVEKKGILETNHGAVLCRDFLCDTLVWKAKEKSPSSVYGWAYFGPVEKKYVSLVIDDFGKIEHNVKSILNPIEKKLEVKLTKVEKTDDGEHVWVKGDKWWMQTTVHFSWYTTMLRCLTHNKMFSELEDLRKFPTNDYLEGYGFDRFCKVVFCLPKLKVTQVSGTKNIKNHSNTTMHNYNGWSSNSDFGAEYKLKFAEYGEQFRALLT
jgi:hypothetical protein